MDKHAKIRAPALKSAHSTTHGMIVDLRGLLNDGTLPLSMRRPPGCRMP